MSDSEKRWKKVAVLKGGPSSEREVSLRSGAAVAHGLRQVGYEVEEVDVTGHDLDLPAGIEAVFIALHGEFGEDGEVQSRLEARRIPYTGSGVMASRASFDKRMSKAIFQCSHIPSPDYELVHAGEKTALYFPVVIKPPCQGSTIGIHKISSATQWKEALADTLRYGAEAIVERYIPGRELTVGIVGDQVLPVIEIAAPEGWYDYHAKYGKTGQTRYLAPAPLNEATAHQCQVLAMKTFHALKCRGMGRVDFRLSPDGELFVLELNNIPGFTETSLLPKAARLVGMEFPQLCDRIMQLATLDAS